VAQPLAGDCTLVLDRAYEPLRLAGACSLGDEALARVWQLWSPNKALGLTGVRAAYAIAPADAAAAVAALDALAPSWPVGAHGVAMLLAWCEPSVQQWLAQSRAILGDWKVRQQALCEDLGWTVLPSGANFFVVQAPELAQALPALREHGIKLRDCASFGLAGHVRLGVLPPGSQDALRRAWSELKVPA
jgi:histidinol-phosphate aminotransferase